MKEKINTHDYNECINIFKSFEASNELILLMAQMCKNTYYRVDRYWIHGLHNSYQNFHVLLLCGIEKTPFTFNYATQKIRGTKSKALKEMVMYDLLQVGMMVVDKTGRYDRYTVTKHGIDFLFLMLTKCEKCNLTGICKTCNGGGKCKGNTLCDSCTNNNQCFFKGLCWDCKGTLRCNECEYKIDALDGIEGIKNLVQGIASF